VKWDVLQLRRGGARRRYKDKKCVGEKRHDKKRAAFDYPVQGKKRRKARKRIPCRSVYSHALLFIGDRF